MKYINHMTSSGDDDRHAEMMERHGLAGYGAYWRIAEMIAAQIRPEQITVWMLRSWKRWGDELGVKPSYAMKLISSLHEVGLISLSSDNHHAAIGMPNLLKYADEYTKTILKKSGETPESLGRMSSPPALPAYRKNKDLKTSACGIVDNPPASDGANGGGNAEGHPPAAPPLTEIVMKERAEAVRRLNRRT